VKELDEAQGDDGTTVKSKGEPLTPLPRLVPPAAKDLVPITSSEYDPLTVAT
jgi:hypothetical protein